MNVTEGGTMPDDVLLSVYGALSGFNDMPVTGLDETRDEARCRYAQEIQRRGLLDAGCTCDVCEAVRADIRLWRLA